MPALAALCLAAIAGLLARRLRVSQRPARALIISSPRSTVIAGDGAVRSVQSARLTMSTADLDRLWVPDNLENLGRTYWRFLSRVTLGLIRVRYTHSERAVVALGFITLLRFTAPDYALEPLHGRVNWPIKDGLLVAKTGHGCGWLRLDVQRKPSAGDPLAEAEVMIDVEVANFYPAIASGLSIFVYEITQAFVHVLVTHAVLRSLAKLDLAESKVRRLRDA
jgi:hypothetical protein